MPPDLNAERGPVTALAQLSDLDAEVFGSHGTARPGRRSPTLTYLRGRERVLGGRLVLHHEPEVAAALAVEALGPIAARAWARRLLAELEVRT